MALNQQDIDLVIEMAWEDRTTFDAIETQFGLSESEVTKLMKREMKLSSWKMWRKRVQGRKTKHAAKRVFSAGPYKSRNISSSIFLRHYKSKLV